MMLKRCNKLYHPSRVKLPFVRMSASWFLDSTYLIWSYGSRLILSNNQSRATRWVRDTCLFVGLLPLMITFITASLSAKVYNCASFSERCAFEGTWSTFDRSTFWSLGVLWILHRFPACMLRLVLVILESFQVLQWPNPTSQVQIDSVELWDTDVYFLHIQLIGTNVRLPTMHNTPPDVDFESSRSPAMSESWNNPNRQSWAAFLTWQHWR